jgi:hypothetical protein
VFYACETIRFLTAKASVKTLKAILKVNLFPLFLELLGQAMYQEIVYQILCNILDACVGSILLDKRVCPHVLKLIKEYDDPILLEKTLLAITTIPRDSVSQVILVLFALNYTSFYFFLTYFVFPFSF